MSGRSRFAAIKIRLALILVGVALGLAARWVTGGFTGPAQRRFFEPIPDDVLHQLEDDKALAPPQHNP